jgi:hypothetical protein
MLCTPYNKRKTTRQAPRCRPERWLTNVLPTPDVTATLFFVLEESEGRSGAGFIATWMRYRSRVFSVVDLRICVCCLELHDMMFDGGVAARKTWSE